MLYGHCRSRRLPLKKSLKKNNYLLFRIRRSETAVMHNRYENYLTSGWDNTNSSQADPQLETPVVHHGSGQALRSEGRRDRGSRYTGCEAGFMVCYESIVEDGQAKWVVRVVPGTEIFKHSHPTNKIIYESYSTPTSQELSLPVRRELDLLQDMKTGSADINRYLSDKLEDVDNDVLIVQDQIDITYIIAIQTAIQKPFFLAWGDDLVMDWAHWTNNLGYHLGKQPSCYICHWKGRSCGRFLALDQKAGTMELILNLFKQKNSSWGFIQTVVIDNDFVDGGYRRKCFPTLRSSFANFMHLPIGGRNTVGV
ncbi:hypothetical protein PHMEG_00014089 [Phytophthora megakarya]|uniref:ZSWIM1/3 RNaseH-like domain-containing protein n=1 Tax=Phytophthora megakarya TaxID=4795 RepID=A0A225W574_9STRA|nr:hypothetical protein PHMEG_00014089 [Phytophthora megakarya]